MIIANKQEEMKLSWCPERAMKAYIDTVESCGIDRGSTVAEFISAMAAGWNARLIVEAWSPGGATTTSIGLSVASRHTGGRHVCILPDEGSRSEYIRATAKAGVLAELMVGEAEEVMAGLTGADFLVVDCRRNDFARVLRHARLGSGGAVLMRKNASLRRGLDFQWQSVLDSRSRVVRSVLLPVGKGVDIAHVATGGGSSGEWMKQVDPRQ